MCMNKYVASSDYKKVYVWYICPRRKGDGEDGCGHKTLIEIKRIATDRNVELILDSRIVGEVRSTDNLSMIIRDNLETFDTWLHNNRKIYKDKKVEVTMQIIEKEFE